MQPPDLAVGSRVEMLPQAAKLFPMRAAEGVVVRVRRRRRRGMQVEVKPLGDGAPEKWPAKYWREMRG